MSPIDSCASAFANRGVDFAPILEQHYKHGYVVSTPDVFAMGRPVCSGWTPEQICDPEYNFYGYRQICDAWWFQGFYGKPCKLWPMIPFSLDLAGWSKFDKCPRFYPMITLRRLTVVLDEPAAVYG